LLLDYLAAGIDIDGVDNSPEMLAICREKAQKPGLQFADLSFLDRKAVFGLVPGLGEQVVAGIFSPASGQANPRLTNLAFANAAKRHDAIYWTSTECLALQRVADRVVGAQTGQSLVQAKQIVLAAGAWSRKLANSVGIQLPLRMRVLQVLLTTPAQPGVLQPVLSAVGRALSAKQLSDGALLLGGGWSGDPTPNGRS
jgi:sarcosine oxidase subunit beta